MIKKIGLSLVVIFLIIFSIGCNQKEQNFNVYFISEDGMVLKQLVLKEGEVLENLIPEKKDGYEFMGWYLNGSKYNFNTKVTKDITLIAKWEKIEEIKSYKVTFNTNGGTVINNQIINENEHIIEPKSPTKEGYEFMGWYLNGSKYNFNTKVTKDIILIAMWKEILIEKIIDVTENIQYSTKKINEKNMLKGETSIVQEGVFGIKNINYKVVYNYFGKEISKIKLSENIVTNPIEEIIKVGTSDYNLNTDKIYKGEIGFCLEEDLLVVNGEKVPACTKEPLNIIYAYINDKEFYYIADGSYYLNITNAIEFVNGYTISYDNKLYESVGGSGSEEPDDLTEQDCEKFDFECGIW